ncbi:hypothetical protein CB1_001428049 [Camelus ferus]|nr:hypothetical protein CB1_001428049 [Camelus ferus]
MDMATVTIQVLHAPLRQREPQHFIKTGGHRRPCCVAAGGTGGASDSCKAPEAAAWVLLAETTPTPGSSHCTWLGWQV